MYLLGKKRHPKVERFEAAALLIDERANNGISRLVFQRDETRVPDPSRKCKNSRCNPMVQQLIPQGHRSREAMNCWFKVLGITFKIQRLIGSNITVLIDVKELIVLLRKERYQPVGFVPNWSLTAEPTMVSVGWFSRT